MIWRNKIFWILANVFGLVISILMCFWAISIIIAIIRDDQPINGSIIETLVYSRILFLLSLAIMVTVFRNLIGEKKKPKRKSITKIKNKITIEFS